MPPSPKRSWSLIALAVILLAAPACHKQEKANANRDAEKDRERLMKEMDRIQAEEAAKHKPPTDNQPNAESPAEPTPPAHPDPQPAPDKKP
jgi:hypothetical protein